MLNQICDYPLYEWHAIIIFTTVIKVFKCKLNILFKKKNRFIIIILMFYELKVLIFI